jgi:hypothetical protein
MSMVGFGMHNSVLDFGTGYVDYFLKQRSSSARPEYGILLRMLGGG